MEELRKLVDDEMTRQGLSLRDVERNSGELVSHSTVGNIRSGKHTGKLDDQTLAGLALGLNVPLPKIRTAYGMKTRAPRKWVLPPGHEYLTPEQQNAVNAIIKAFLKANGPRVEGTSRGPRVR